MTKDGQATAKDAENAAKNAKALFVPRTTDLVQSPELRELNSRPLFL